MDKLQDSEYLKRNQYRDSSRLQSRIDLHRDYSTGSENWFQWVFNRFKIPSQARILEIGCGPGHLWVENLNRLPADWSVTLTDFSEGMLRETHRQLGKLPGQFWLAAADARKLPFPAQTFHAAIANHMLYHVPDRSAALREIRRILRPQGTFYAATVGMDHMQDLAELVSQFAPEAAEGFQESKNPFTLDNGPDQLRGFFDRVQVDRHPSDLRVTRANPLVDYVLSSFRLGVDESQREDFRIFVKRQLDRHGGVITIRKDNGLLTAVKSG